MTINYVEGDASRPNRTGLDPIIIAHVCNNWGAWGAGFTGALSRYSRTPEFGYRSWFLGVADDIPFELGEIKFADYFPPGIVVCNMIAQWGIGPDEEGEPPIRYGALKLCLQRLTNVARAWNASVHMPKIGCGLAGGDWRVVSRIIESTLCAKKVPVTVYNLPARPIINL